MRTAGSGRKPIVTDAIRRVLKRQHQGLTVRQIADITGLGMSSISYRISRMPDVVRGEKVTARTYRWRLRDANGVHDTGGGDSGSA